MSRVKELRRLRQRVDALTGKSLVEVPLDVRRPLSAQYQNAMDAALPDLLDVAEAAQAVCEHWEARGDGYCTARLAVALSAALARLEGTP